eukprot:GHVP01004979.1.p1 GENE.GHVP01004979.1~~GHVP01004979.1.p1  ORF type:complete len:1017 (-),score=164.74 GHVP01004979.1:61-3111(-)
MSSAFLLTIASLFEFLPFQDWPIPFSPDNQIQFKSFIIPSYTLVTFIITVFVSLLGPSFAKYLSHLMTDELRMSRHEIRLTRAGVMVACMTIPYVLLCIPTPLQVFPKETINVYFITVIRSGCLALYQATQNRKAKSRGFCQKTKRNSESSIFADRVFEEFRLSSWNPTFSYSVLLSEMVIVTLFSFKNPYLPVLLYIECAILCRFSVGLMTSCRRDKNLVSVCSAFPNNYANMPPTADIDLQSIPSSSMFSSSLWLSIGRVLLSILTYTIILSVAFSGHLNSTVIVLMIAIFELLKNNSFIGSDSLPDWVWASIDRFERQKHLCFGRMNTQKSTAAGRNQHLSMPHSRPFSGFRFHLPLPTTIDFDADIPEDSSRAQKAKTVLGSHKGEERQQKATTNEVVSKFDGPLSYKTRSEIKVPKDPSVPLVTEIVPKSIQVPMPLFLNRFRGEWQVDGGLSDSTFPVSIHMGLSWIIAKGAARVTPRSQYYFEEYPFMKIRTYSSYSMYGIGEKWNRIRWDGHLHHNTTPEVGEWSHTSQMENHIVRSVQTKVSNPRKSLSENRRIIPGFNSFGVPDPYLDILHYSCGLREDKIEKEVVYRISRRTTESETPNIEDLPPHLELSQALLAAHQNPLYHPISPKILDLYNESLKAAANYVEIHSKKSSKPPKPAEAVISNPIYIDNETLVALNPSPSGTLPVVEKLLAMREKMQEQFNRWKTVNFSQSTRGSRANFETPNPLLKRSWVAYGDSGVIESRDSFTQKLGGSNDSVQTTTAPVDVTVLKTSLSTEFVDLDNQNVYEAYLRSLAQRLRGLEDELRNLHDSTEGWTVTWKNPQVTISSCDGNLKNRPPMLRADVLVDGEWEIADILDWIEDDDLNFQADSQLAKTIWMKKWTDELRLCYQAYHGRFGFSGRDFIFATSRKINTEEGEGIIAAQSLEWDSPENPYPNCVRGTVHLAGWRVKKRQTSGAYEVTYFNQTDLQQSGVPNWVVQRVKSDQMKKLILFHKKFLEPPHPKLKK